MEVTYIPVRGQHRRKGLLVESDTERGIAVVLDQASLKFVSCPLAGVKEVRRVRARDSRA